MDHPICDLCYEPVDGIEGTATVATEDGRLTVSHTRCEVRRSVNSILLGSGCTMEEIRRMEDEAAGGEFR